MPIKTQMFVNRIWRKVLQMDNHLIGLLICVFASYSWLAFYDGIGSAQLYFPQGIYALPSLSILNTFFSAVYLTFAAIILLSLRPPLSRYDTALPNLTAVLAAFTVYAFVFVPGGELLRFNTIVALILIISGSLIIITSLIFLRQAFSVTPQARFLVTSGPYSVVRHPMYLGNILSILGLALLIDSVWAIVLFFICGGLQIARALYEEKLLQENLPGYREYKRRVGRFFPLIPRRRQLSTAAFVLVVLFPVTGGKTAATTSETFPTGQVHGMASERSDGMTRPPFDAKPRLVRVAASSADWAKKCDAIYKKAIAGIWFSQSDQKDFKENAEVKDSIPACKTFNSLRDKCSEIAESWMVNETKDVTFMNAIETTPGCLAMAGFDNVCAALKNIARKGTRLTDDRRALMADCAKSDIRKQRFDLLRPAM